MMRIAVTYENGNVFQHFGHSSQFKIYDVEDGNIVKAEVVDTNGQGHGALVGFLQAQEVNAVIAGGIGGGAKQGLAEASIDLYGGVTGSADDAVKELLNGTLKFNPDVACSHHDHQHDHGEPLWYTWLRGSSVTFVYSPKGDDSLEEYYCFLSQWLPLLQGR